MADKAHHTELDLPWHMVIDQVSHELGFGFAGRDMYDIIVEAELDVVEGQPQGEQPDLEVQ